MGHRWRLTRRRRFLGWLGALAALLALTLLGGDTLAADSNHAVEVKVAADCNVAGLDTNTNAFLDDTNTRPAAWEMRTLEQTSLMQDTVDQTQWAHTTRLANGDVLSIGAERRAEWSTTTDDDTIAVPLLTGFDGGETWRSSITAQKVLDGSISATDSEQVATNNVHPNGEYLLTARSVGPTHWQAAMPRSVVAQGNFIFATSGGGNVLLE